MSTPQVPPGWYPDPGDPARTRWWDGFAWTDRTQPPPYTGTYAAPNNPTPPNQPYPPQGYPAQGYPAAQGYPPAPGYPAGAQWQQPGPLGPTGVPLASFWRRLGGYLIDQLILAVPTTLIAIPILLPTLGDFIREIDANSERLDPNSPAYDPAYWTTLVDGQFFASLAVIGVLSLAISAAYWIVAIGRFGRTVGGLAVGVRAIDVNGSLPGYGRATVRWAVPASTNLIGLIPFVGFVGVLLQLLIYLWILWDPQRQGLHDKAAGTYVILDR
jgi:uncharacterized RDD family membrane protein YckC